MSIIRIKKRKDPYVRIDKTCLEDASLSFKAKGLLAYLLSKPDDWKISVKQLSKASTDGMDSVQSALKELESQGYAVLEPSRNDNGSLNGKSWTIYENPDDLDTKLDRQAENRHVGKPPTDRFPVRRKTGTSVRHTINCSTKNECTNNSSPNGEGDTLTLESDVPPKPPEEEEKTPPLPPSAHKLFIARWFLEYRNVHETKYAFSQGKDGAAVKRLLATELSVDELIELAKQAWRNPSGFNCKFAASISGFSSRFNEIRLELKNPNHSGNGRGSYTPGFTGTPVNGF